MNLQEKQQLKAILVATALYYGQEIADSALALFVEDLEDLPFPQIVQALKEIRRDPKTTRLPLPAVIRAKLNPEVDERSQAVMVSNSIWDAVGKFGWPNPDRAKAFLGELAWTTVERGGGWLNICQDANQSEPSIMKAQIRDLAVAVIQSAKSGQLHRLPELPKPENKVAQLIQMKGMEK